MTDPVAARAVPGVWLQLTDLLAQEQHSRGLDLLARQPSSSLLAGQRGSRLRGRGLDFQELRHYRQGDDIRAVDWRTTRRTGRPHVRVFAEERERQLLVLVDQRTGMFFGSQLRMKSVVAAELAALVAFAALAAGDRVRGTVITDTAVATLPGGRSRQRLMPFLHQVVAANQLLRAGGKVNLERQLAQLDLALDATQRQAGHNALVVLVSDLDGWGEHSLGKVKRLARHNDVVVLLVYDPLETALPDATRLVVSDGDLQLELDTADQELSSGFAAAHRDRVASLGKELTRYDVPVIPVDTVQPVGRQLRQALGGHPGAGPRG